MNVLAMPFLFRSMEHLPKVLDGPIGEEILGSFEPFGFVGLTFYDSGAGSIYNSVRPIRTLADMKGLRLRVQQSELMSEIIKALGAVPVELRYGQVRTGLATKLIDGAENNWPSFATTDHYKYAGFSRRRAQTGGVIIVRNFDRKPFEAAMSPRYAKVQRDPATAALIERIRKVN